MSNITRIKNTNANTNMYICISLYQYFYFLMLYNATKYAADGVPKPINICHLTAVTMHKHILTNTGNISLIIAQEGNHRQCI